MNAQSSTLKAFTDAAADAVGREIARLRTEAKRQEELRDAEYRARTAELETRILAAANLERSLSERLASLKDGEDGKDGVDGHDGKDGTDGRDGNGVDEITVTQSDATVEFAFAVGETQTIFEVELPEGPPGKDGERGLEGPAGKIEKVATWSDEVQYEGAIRTHNGATWQALKDTAKEPPHEDWRCLAERGADGNDGRSFTHLGTYNPDGEYRAFDVVTLNGGSFVARMDNPGACPGDGWRLLASQGKTGRPGEPGKRGEPGPPGPKVEAMHIDGEGMLTLINADGSTVQCDLYPVLSKISSC